MTPEAVNLSPSERLALIPPPRITSSSGNSNSESTSALSNLKKRVVANSGEDILSNHQPGSQRIEYLPYTVEQELEICRRYLQDFICFDYGIPSSCVKYAKEVY
jgi:hypothetical protein